MAGLNAAAPAPESVGQAPSKEQQAAYNRFVGFSLVHLWDEGFMKNAIEILKKAPDITDGMARVTITVGTAVYKKAKEQGADIPDEVVLHGGWEILNNVADMARDIGLQVTDEDVEDAMHDAATMFMEIGSKEGWIDQQKIEAGAAELQEMEAQGQIDPAMRERAAARRGGMK